MLLGTRTQSKLLREGVWGESGPDQAEDRERTVLSPTLREQIEIAGSRSPMLSRPSMFYCDSASLQSVDTSDCRAGGIRLNEGKRQVKGEGYVSL